MDTNEKLLRMLAQDEQQKKWQAICITCHRPIILSENNHAQLETGKNPKFQHVIPCRIGPSWAQN